MGGWTIPDILKDLNAISLVDEDLVYYHDQMHVFWRKLEDGFTFEWTFAEVYEKHRNIVNEMTKRKIKHIFPINNLDNVPASFVKEKEVENEQQGQIYYVEKILGEEKKVIGYSIEKKMNGFHVGVHKKGDEVKIFSEHKKDLTIAFPTLVENIKKLGNNFIIDGELVPYDPETGKVTGRNALMKYIGAIKSGKKPSDENIKLHVWDILYHNKSITDLSLRERIIELSNLKFNPRVIEIERKLIKRKEDLEKNIKWATGLENSEGAIVKDLNASYHFGDHKSWRKYRKLVPINVSVLKKIPKERNLYNYLVGVPATKKYLNPKHIQDKYLVLGHTFNTKEIFNEGDKITILIEEVWRHETTNGIHYSIHKPRVKGKTNEDLSNIDYLEDIVTSVGVAVTHAILNGQEILIGEELAERIEPKGREEGREIAVKDFPRRMQKNFRDVMEKKAWLPFVMQWHLRGERSIHTDHRFEIPAGYLEGFTYFTPPSLDKPDLLTNGTKNVRGTIKVPQPSEWMKAEGRFKSGAPGTTKKHDAFFTIVAKGNYTIHEVEDHKIVFELKCDKGKVKEFDEKQNPEPYINQFNKKLPDSLKQLNGRYSYHIAHIGEKYIILLDKLLE